ARRQATSLLAQALPADPEDPVHWPTWRTLLPHIDALAGHTTTADATLAYLLNQAGRLLDEQGAVHRAITYHPRALTDHQQLLGADHPDTLISRNNLAAAYESAGDLGRAIPLLEQTLTDRQRVLGAD